LPPAQIHRIPVKPGQIRYLLSLEPFGDQAALARKLGTSPRYLRRMLTGERPGFKYSGKIWKLYESHRRKATPQVPPKRVAPSTRGFAPTAGVVKILQHIFQPTDAQKVPSAKRPWQARETKYASKEKKVRGKFDSWDGFSIVMVQGNSDQGVVSIRRYKPRGGAQHHLDFEEERMEGAEEFESATIDEIAERFYSLSVRHAEVIAHLPVEEWIDGMREKAFSEPIFNFWVSRFSERPKAGAFGLARDPADPQTLAVVEANCEMDVDGASGEDFQFDLVGVYAFTGWNKKAGKKPPRQ
jgi:hypothetical protein